VIALKSAVEARGSFVSHPVSLIIALLLSGLVIDLGGGPDHDKIGFRVRNEFISEFIDS